MKKLLVSLGLTVVFLGGIILASVKGLLAVVDVPEGWKKFDDAVWGVAEPLSDQQTTSLSLLAIAFGGALLVVAICIAFLRIHRRRNEEADRRAQILQTLDASAAGAGADQVRDALLLVLLDQGIGRKERGGWRERYLLGGAVTLAVAALGGGAALLLHHEITEPDPPRLVHNDSIVAPEERGKQALATAQRRAAGDRARASGDQQRVAGVRASGADSPVEPTASTSCVCPPPPGTAGESGGGGSWEQEETWGSEETWESEESWEPEESWESEEDWESEEAWGTEEESEWAQEEGSW